MEKNLTTEQSLDLIARMIATTRRNFNDRGGVMFLIWGYTTVLATLAVFITFSLTGSYEAMWIWCALPLNGGILTWIHLNKHPRPVTTHLDRSVGAVWVIFSGAAACCMISTYVSWLMVGKPYIDILFSIGLMMSMATAITGRLIKFRPVEFGGIVGMGLAFALPAAAGTVWQMPLFAAVFVVAQIVPGHLLDAACKREAAATTTTAAQNGRAE